MTFSEKYLLISLNSVEFFFSFFCETEIMNLIITSLCSESTRSPIKRFKIYVFFVFRQLGSVKNCYAVKIRISLAVVR